MEFFEDRPFDPMPGDVVRIEVLDGDELVAYTGLVSVAEPTGDGSMHLSFWTEPALDAPESEGA